MVVSQYGGVASAAASSYVCQVRIHLPHHDITYRRHILILLPPFRLRIQIRKHPIIRRLDRAPRGGSIIIERRKCRWHSVDAPTWALTLLRILASCPRERRRGRGIAAVYRGVRLRVGAHQPLSIIGLFSVGIASIIKGVSEGLVGIVVSVAVWEQPSL